jgi:hypothetical protein
MAGNLAHRPLSVDTALAAPLDAAAADLIPEAMKKGLARRPETPPGHRKLRRNFLSSVRVGKASDVTLYIFNPHVAGLERPDEVGFPGAW